MSTAARKYRGDVHGSISSPKKYRAGGSCVECKRLKIKCTRSSPESFPCDPCIRRGYQSVCPEGPLMSGKAGSRLILADTQELHQKISQLSSRVRELEGALQELQAASSTEPHPLLRGDIVLADAPFEPDTFPVESEPSPEGQKPIDAFGSLSLRRFGRSNFHAQTAGSWYYLQNEDSDPVTPQDEAQYPLPVDVLFASHTFPLTTLKDTRHELRVRIHAFIPDRDTATYLVDRYFHGLAWMFDPVPKPLFLDTIFNAVYAQHSTPVLNCDSSVLSVFFAVLAIGSLLDLDVPNHSPLATQFYHFSRAALSLDLVLDQPSITTIQALHLIGFFSQMSDFKDGFGTSWALMGLISKLATGIGLHRDGSMWNLGKEDDIRRHLFWEMYTFDTWQSLTCGRPPSFQRLTVDCKMPYTALLAPDATIDDPDSLFKAWKHRFCYEQSSFMIEQSFGPGAPPYATILLLDRKIREDPIPPLLQLGSTLTASQSPNEHANASLKMQRYTVMFVRELSLLLMHRPYFAQAVTEKAPLETKFAPSVLAVYRSSFSIITGLRALYDQQPQLTTRVWFFWTQAFSAAVCLGGLVVRCPSLSIAPSALAQVDSACEIFSKVTDSHRATRSLPSMLKLRDEARLALSEFRAGQNVSSTTQRELNELSALVGETRLVVHRTQVPPPEQSNYGCANLPDGHLVPGPPLLSFHDTHTSSDGMHEHADQGYPPRANPSQVDVLNSSHEYSGLRRDVEGILAASLSQKIQDEPEYHTSQGVTTAHLEHHTLFSEQRTRDETWKNFVNQLGMNIL